MVRKPGAKDSRRQSPESWGLGSLLGGVCVGRGVWGGAAESDAASSGAEGPPVTAAVPGQNGCAASTGNHSSHVSSRGQVSPGWWEPSWGWSREGPHVLTSLDEAAGMGLLGLVCTAEGVSREDRQEAGSQAHPAGCLPGQLGAGWI